MKQNLNHLFSVIILLIGLTLFIFMSTADLGIARLIFSHYNQWPGLYHEPWTFLYTMAPNPGLKHGYWGSVLLYCLGIYLTPER